MHRSAIVFWRTEAVPDVVLAIEPVPSLRPVFPYLLGASLSFRLWLCFTGSKLCMISSVGPGCDMELGPMSSKAEAARAVDANPRWP